MFPEQLVREIQKRKDVKNHRILRLSGQAADFSSNDYLGFAQSPKLKEKIRWHVEQHSPANGATGSRLLTGNSENTIALEKKLATFFNAEAALIFNSGYIANLAVLSSVPQKGDTILYDDRSHASIKDGVRLCSANRFSFKHNDLADLELKIKKASGQVFIVVESVYSMDGDLSPLKALVKLANDTDAVIILDEAHSTGWMGESGNGLAASLTVEKDIPVRIHTFGKALGVHGACICGSQILIDYLINFARPFIYTTALPPHSIIAISCALDLLFDSQSTIQQLFSVISRFLEQTAGLPGVSRNHSCIQSVIIGDNERVKNLSAILQENNLDVRPILSPTVPKGKERLRICLHAYNTGEEIEKLANILSKHI